MKASEAVAMVSGLVAKYGRLAVEGELKAIRDGRAKPQVEVDTVEVVARLSGNEGTDSGLDEVESILAALPVPAAPAPARPRAKKAEVESLVAAVLDQVRTLGREFTSAEIAGQFSKPVGKVSHALHLLVKRGLVKLEGTRKNARYSVVTP